MVRRTSILALCLVSLWHLLPPNALALDPKKGLTQYNHKIWTKRDGLPMNSVVSLAQSPDGFLWLGTHEGLARFDGLSVRIYNPLNTAGIGGKIVSSIRTGRDGTLWLGIDGVGIVTMRQGIFREISIAKPEEPLRIGPIYEDRNGRIWASTSMALLCFRGDSVEKAFTMADGLRYNYVSGIAEDAAGRLLVASGGSILELQDECFVEYPVTTSLRGKARVLRSDPDGALWIGTFDAGVVRADTDGLRHFNTRDGLSSPSILSLLLDSQGALWVGTAGGGLNRIFNDRIESYAASAGLSGDDVYQILEDREGNIWAGVLTGGLDGFFEGKFTTYLTGTTSSQKFVYSVFEDRGGTLLAGTASRQVMLFAGGTFIPHPAFPARLAGSPLAFLRDSRGDLWVGTSAGLYRRSGGRTIQYTTGFTAAIAEDNRGRIWVGGYRGLMFYDKGAFVRYTDPFAGEYPDVRAIRQERTGHLWVATRNLGLLRFLPPDDLTMEERKPPRDFVWYAKGDGLGSDWVTSLTIDEADKVWVTAFGGGLSTIREGRIINLTGGGIPEDGLLSLVDDDNGSFWLTSNNGILRVSRSDLERLAAGGGGVVAWEKFGLASGMASDECNGGYQSAGLRTHSGYLWFPTTMGVVEVDPDSVPVNRVPPAVVLEHVRVGSRVVSTLLPLRVPPGAGALEFEYTGISMSAPDLVQFRIMLEGFDRGWVDVGARRVCSYTNVPPGTYTFRVQARNADGVWDEAGASFPFTREPYFTQTPWFYMLCVVGVLLCGAGLHAVYRRDRERQLVAAQLESQLARAQLKMLEMQVQPHFLFNALNGISVLISDDPDRASRMIMRLSDFVRMALERTGRQEISLREELLFVDKYLSIELLRFADRLAVRHEIREELLDALVPAMILQPLVENAIRHGVSRRRGPVTIRLEAARANGTLMLHVRDNGAGISPEDLSGVREGVGLTNTRARLRQLYGNAQSVELRCAPGGGVDVSLTLPYHEEPLT